MSRRQGSAKKKVVQRNTVISVAKIRGLTVPRSWRWYAYAIAYKLLHSVSEKEREFSYLHLNQPSSWCFVGTFIIRSAMILCSQLLAKNKFFGFVFFGNYVSRSIQGQFFSVNFARRPLKATHV